MESVWKDAFKQSNIYWFFRTSLTSLFNFAVTRNPQGDKNEMICFLAVFLYRSVNWTMQQTESYSMQTLLIARSTIANKSQKIVLRASTVLIGTVWPFWCWCAIKLWYNQLSSFLQKTKSAICKSIQICTMRYMYIRHTKDCHIKWLENNLAQLMSTFLCTVNQQYISIYTESQNQDYMVWLKPTFILGQKQKSTCCDFWSLNSKCSFGEWVRVFPGWSYNAGLLLLSL